MRRRPASCGRSTSGEGQDTAAGAEVASLEVPDLATRTAQKRAEIAEGEARLGLARAGSRTPAPQAMTEFMASRAEQGLAAAQLARLREELAYLGSLREKQSVRSPVAGVMVTPHLEEKVGQFLKEGDLICTVEDCADLRVEVRLPEGEVERVRPGQAVECKARALPFATLRGIVQEVAPVAVPGKDGAPGTITVYCRLVDVPRSVRPAMTGDARISCGRRPAAVCSGARCCSTCGPSSGGDRRPGCRPGLPAHMKTRSCWSVRPGGGGAGARDSLRSCAS